MISIVHGGIRGDAKGLGLGNVRDSQHAGGQEISKVGAVVEMGKLHGENRGRFLDGFPQMGARRGVAGFEMEAKRVWRRRNARSKGMVRTWRV